MLRSLAVRWQLWGTSLSTSLGEPLFHAINTYSFYGSEKGYGKARLVTKDMQEFAGAGASAPKISLQGIDGVLFPSDLTSLVPKEQVAGIKYGTDPPLPEVKMSKPPKPGTWASGLQRHSGCAHVAVISSL